MRRKRADKPAQYRVKFATSLRDRDTIKKIADRAVTLYAKYGKELDPTSTQMDISAVHANGNPLRLQDLLAADDFNFMHDITGIYRHLDRDTGKLADYFTPRFSRNRAAEHAEAKHDAFMAKVRS